MASTIGTSNNSIEALETAYQIGKYIHSMLDDPSNKDQPNPAETINYLGHFNLGPMYPFDQTKKGLVICEWDNIPSRICTPYGSWMIVGSSAGDFHRIFQAIKKSLGLVRIKEEYHFDGKYAGTQWAITEWQGRKMEEPEFRRHYDYNNSEQVKAVWKYFAAMHPELTK